MEDKKNTSKSKFPQMSAQEFSDKILKRSKNKKVNENDTNEQINKLLNKKRENKELQKKLKSKKIKEKNLNESINSNESLNEDNSETRIFTKPEKKKNILSKLESVVTKQKEDEEDLKNSIRSLINKFNGKIITLGLNGKQDAEIDDRQIFSSESESDAEEISKRRQKKLNKEKIQVHQNESEEDDYNDKEHEVELLVSRSKKQKLDSKDKHIHTHTNINVTKMNENKEATRISEERASNTKKQKLDKVEQLQVESKSQPKVPKEKNEKREKKIHNESEQDISKINQVTKPKPEKSSNIRDNGEETEEVYVHTKKKDIKNLENNSIEFNHNTESSDQHAELFVKNLSYYTTDELLKQYFLQFGKVAKVKILTKPDGSSKGIGFVEFEKRTSAEKALSQASKLFLEGRSLTVCFSGDTSSEFKGNVNFSTKFSNQTKHTVFITNIDLNASAEQIKRHFNMCGEILEIRIARDKEGNPKGFTHIDFKNEEGLQNALRMDGTKLDGRTIKVQSSNSLPKNREHKPQNQNYSNNNKNWKYNNDGVNNEGRFKYYKNSSQEDTARRTGTILKSDSKKVTLLD